MYKVTCNGSVGAQHFEVFKWPSQAPDLKAIENLEIINVNCDKSCRSFNEAQLWEKPKEEWKEVKHDICAKFSESVSIRIAVVIKNNREPTKY